MRFADKRIGYATASVEGRIAVEYFDPSKEAQELKYAFKCHRAVIDGADHVWPVNSLVFHPKSVLFSLCYPRAFSSLRKQVQYICFCWLGWQRFNVGP